MGQYANRFLRPTFLAAAHHARLLPPLITLTPGKAGSGKKVIYRL